MQQMDWNTHNIVNDNLEALKQLFPEAFSEDKVDFEKLQLLLWANISNDKEKYSFSWKGKNDAIKLALAQNTWTLRPDKESSKNWDTTQNLYIEWDNLEVLRTLQDSYRWQVKMIYIDPPYNTWKDFVYKDDFHDNVSSYKEKMWENMKSNPETNGRYHTDWLNMMYPRLKLARNLLKDDWVIFISIDEHEVTNLWKLMEELYTFDNLDFLVWQKTDPWFDRNTNSKVIRRFAEFKEIIIIWYKSKHKTIFNKISKLPDWKMSQSNPDNDPRWPWQSWIISYEEWHANEEKDSEYYYTIESYSWNKTTRHWFYKKDELEALIADDRVYFPKNWDWVPRFKNFENEEWSYYMNSIFRWFWTTSSAKAELKDLFWIEWFDTPKPTKLIQELSRAWTWKDDIILDFFSWSWTTAHAVMQLNAEDWGNRKFIMVQIPEETATDSEAYKAWYKNICEIWKERIRRAWEKILQKNKDKEWIENLDIWFKVFKLDTTNLKKWETSVEWETEDEIKKELQMRLQDMTNPVKEDRNQIDMVYEIMLKNGMDLTLPMQELSIKWKKVFSIADNYLIACLEKNIDLETVKEIANLNPKVTVFYDDSFADDRVKINAIQNLEKSEIQVRVI